jgi:hypothetical protein
MTERNIDKLWTHILKEIKYNPTNTKCIITAEQIKSCKDTWNGKANQFEPRLLCKLDCIKDTPNIFREYGISLLSFENGKYILLKENIYIPLISNDIKPKKINNSIDSYILKIGNSESSMLDILHYNGVFDEILEEKIKYTGLSGRHRCNFSTNINGLEIKIKGSQYETDGCYESKNKICIVEAKMKPYEDFNIRQLYYPFREVYDVVGTNKEIYCLYIFKDKSSIIHIYKFEWQNYKNMLDVENTGYYTYKIINKKQKKKIINKKKKQ